VNDHRRIQPKPVVVHATVGIRPASPTASKSTPGHTLARSAIPGGLSPVTFS
jgi:hypothetical protein